MRGSTSETSRQEAATPSASSNDRSEVDRPELPKGSVARSAPVDRPPRAAVVADPLDDIGPAGLGRCPVPERQLPTHSWKTVGGRRSPVQLDAPHGPEQDLPR